jgi:hypothetical protein
MQKSTVPVTYSKRQIIQYYLNEGSYCEDAFVRMPEESEYRLIYEATETESDKMQNSGKIKDYITFDHILCVISDNENFLSDSQLSEIEQGLNNE